MLSIKENQITLTQGDTAEIQITIYYELADEDNPNLTIEDQIYQLQEGDTLHFIVLDMNKEGLSNKSFLYVYNQYVHKELNKPPVIIKDFDSNIIKLDSIDTKFLRTGVYLYGCVLETKDGQINTIQSGDLILTQGFM